MCVGGGGGGEAAHKGHTQSTVLEFTAQTNQGNHIHSAMQVHPKCLPYVIYTSTFYQVCRLLADGIIFSVNIVVLCAQVFF